MHKPCSARTLRTALTDLAQEWPVSVMGAGMAQSAVQKQRMNYHYMADAMRRLEWDLHQKILREGRIPEAWHAIAAERDEPERIRITLGSRRTWRNSSAQ